MQPTQILPTLSPNNGSQLLEKVYQGRQTYEFKRGITIPLHSQELWVVCRGILQLLTLDSEGNEAILGLAYPEMPFGLPFTQIDPYEVIALSDVVLMRITQIELERSPVLAQGILSQLNRRLQQAEDLLALVHLHPVSVRFWELLLLLSKEIGEQTPEGIQIGVRLTHQQLADLVGVTRVTATRVLGSFCKEGWLSIDKSRHFVIHDSAHKSSLIIDRG